MVLQGQPSEYPIEIFSFGYSHKTSFSAGNAENDILSILGVGLIKIARGDAERNSHWEMQTEQHASTVGVRTLDRSGSWR
jgi:hypothetical protein